MALVEMAYTKDEIKEERREMTGNAPPPYPWGLCIRLEKSELEKLGITKDNLPDVGTTVTFTATADVTGVNLSSRMQDDEMSVALQITAMQLGAKE